MRTFKSVVFDEVQELRIEGSNKYCAAKELTKHVDYVLGMSATPIYNYGNEAYAILNMMKEDCLGDWPSFAREWGGWDRSIKDPKAFGAYLRENFLFLRRTRADIGRELPPVNKVVHTVETDQDAVKSIQDLARTLAIRATSGSFTERGMAARELDIMVRHNTGVSKAKAIANYVRLLLEGGETVLLALWHRDVYDIINKELAEFGPLMYTGTESPAQKNESRRAFMAKESPLMMISLRSGVGLDGLQDCCSLVVFGELDWSNSVMAQVTGRVDRDGQSKQVTAIYLVCDEGSDPPMIDLLALKSSQSAGIIDPFSGPTVQHNDESRIQLLAKQYLERPLNNE